MKRRSVIILIAAALSLCGCNCNKQGNFRLLYWNIQNGMWDGQNDNYDRFVEWVSSKNPDVCIWCEAVSHYLTDSDKNMPQEQRYLIDGWPELAARYGHSYVYVGGHRDNFPQVITSKYPIENVSRITGNDADTVVLHGAGWATMDVKGKHINIVTLHLAPHQWRPGLPTDEERKASAALFEGDKYRRREIQYICEHTILSEQAAGEGDCWIMLGDHNSRSRDDNAFYRYDDSGTKLLVHDYIRENTPYRSAVHTKHPGEFHSTMHYAAVLDYVYLTPALMKCAVSADVSHDFYTEPVRDPQELSNFWRPSDHRPIIVDFKF